MGVFFDKEVFESDCLRFAQLFALCVARKGTEEISKVAEEAIEEYYHEYPSPAPWSVGYIRTNNFRNGSWKKYTVLGGNIYEGGVIVSSSGMGEYAKAGISKDAIFSLDMLEGAHGVRGVYGPIVVSSSPISKIEEKVNGVIADEVGDAALEFAKKNGSYTYL